MGLLADANLNALKDDKFWKGVQNAIHLAGWYLLLACTVLSLGLIAAFTDIDPIAMVEAIGIILGLVKGVEGGIKLYQRKKDEKTITNPLPDGNTDSK